MPQTYERLKEFLEKTDDVRLGDDGKSMKVLLCDKHQKMDKSKRASSGHLKYSRRVHVCSARVTEEAVGPVEKQPRVATPPDADNVVNVEQKTVPESDSEYLYLGHSCTIICKGCTIFHI